MYQFTILKKLLPCFFACFIAFNTAKAQNVSIDSLQKLLDIRDKTQREKALIRAFNTNLQTVADLNLSSNVQDMDNFLVKNNVENILAFEYYIESLHQTRLGHHNNSESALVNALKIVDKSDDFLIYTFLDLLAAKQTEDGKVIAAVSSYRLAKKEAIKLEDTNMQLMVDINIADAYYRGEFFSQSLSYLDQAQGIVDTYWPDDDRIKNIIYYNKASNFFSKGNQDSLAIYTEKLRKSPVNTFNLYTFRNRTKYYLAMLQHDYKSAMTIIHAMQHDQNYKFQDRDLQNLADAYYGDNQPDSAQAIIYMLLTKPTESDHPEVKYHLYNILGKIAEQKGDYQTATANFKLSLQQSEDITNRLAEVDNISSQIKLDEIEGYYTLQSEAYERQRLWLIFATVFTLLVALVIFLGYRTVRQKRHYEKLLYDVKREELAFLNSHDVRKYVSNILGLIEVIRQGKDKAEEFLQIEDFLFDTAQQLDASIRNFSAKLDE